MAEILKPGQRGVRPLVRLRPSSVLPAGGADALRLIERVRRSAHEAGRADAVAEVLESAAEGLRALDRLREAQLAGAQREVIGLAIRVAERVIHAEIERDPTVLTELVADARSAVGGDGLVRLYAGARAYAVLKDELVLPDVELREDPLESAWSLRMEKGPSVLTFGLEHQLRTIERALASLQD